MMNDAVREATEARHFATMAMEHDEDPRKALMEATADVEDVHVYHNRVLIAVYLRPERTVRGVILPGRTRAEDEYQCKCGLVLKCGPGAFIDDSRNTFWGQEPPKPGDWVGFRVQDGWLLGYCGPKGKIPVRVVEDSQLMLKLPSPDRIY